MGDPFLNYFALFLLVFVVVVLFYGIIAIHDIPAKIAESRDHPHQDAIHAAGWVACSRSTRCGRFSGSWSMAYRPEHSPSPSRNPGSINEIDQEQGTFKTRPIQPLHKSNRTSRPLQPI